MWTSTHRINNFMIYVRKENFLNKKTKKLHQKCWQMKYSLQNLPDEYPKSEKFSRKGAIFLTHVDVHRGRRGQIPDFRVDVINNSKFMQYSLCTDMKILTTAVLE